MKTPCLITVTGAAGSGKSTMARAIARRCRLPYLDYDSLVQPFLQEMYGNCRHESDYKTFSRRWRKHSYTTLWNTAADCLAMKADTVLSAPCTSERAVPDFFTEFRERYGIDCMVISVELMPDTDLLRKWLVARGEPRDSDKLEQWDGFTSEINKETVWDADIKVVLTEYIKDRVPANLLEILRKNGLSIS